GDYYTARQDHPGVGAILHRLHGFRGPLPPWVILPRPFTTYSPPYKGQSAGFLGTAFDPVVMNEPKINSLAAKDLPLDAIALPTDVTRARLDARRLLLAGTGAASPTGRQELSGPRLEDAYQKAFALLATDDCRRAFDLRREPAVVRDRYG